MGVIKKNGKPTVSAAAYAKVADLKQITSASA